MGFLGSSNREAKEALRSIAENLLNLEINTIIKADMMTARKAPAPEHALLDIANQYAQRLAGSRKDAGFGIGLLTAVKAKDDWDWKGERPGRPTVASGTFFDLYVTARFGPDVAAHMSDGSANATPSLGLTESEKTILTRIRKSSVEIASIMKRIEELEPEQRGWAVGKTRSEINKLALEEANRQKPGVALTDWEWMRIRKIWEIGLEEVVMQTVIQLDGDVVTRINKTYAGGTHSHLWKAHMDGTRVAMDSWRFLVETVGRFLSAAVSLFRK